MCIKALIIDLEGVIININYNRTFEEFRKIGINITYDAQFQKIVADYDSGKLTTEEFFATFKMMYDHENTLNYQSFVDAWNAMLLYIYDENIEFLFKLKQQGYTLILLSNINKLHAEKITKTYGELFLQLFNKIYFSFETHILKPDISAFYVSNVNSNDLFLAITTFFMCCPLLVRALSLN